MTERLLQEALALFPPKEQQNYREFAGWRTHIDALRLHLDGLVLSDRQALFEEAKALILREPNLRGYTRLKLWFFLHPTFEVFEEFWGDDLACRSFADHIGIMRKCFDGYQNIRRRRYKQISKQAQNEARFLAVRYGKILEKHFAMLSVMYHVREKPQRQLTLRLVPNPTISVEAAQTAFTEIEKRVFRDEIEKFRKSIGVTHAALYERIFQLEKFAVDEQTLTADDIILSLEVFDFIPEIPSDWKPMTTAAAMIVSVICKGSWPIFSVEHQTISKVKGARHIHYTVNNALLQHIREAQTGTALGVVHRMRRLEKGLLPVGLKIHCADQGAPGMGFLHRGYFAAHNAGTCYNLPPVGSISAVAEMLTLIEQRAGVSYLDNPDFQIQVCSPGELSARNAALLGVGFYLGSDRLRRYKRGDFVTTHSETGDRLVIYGANQVDRTFEWWGKNDRGALEIGPMPEKLINRTDVLTCQSMRDIENVNLIATLLVHTQFGGYWAELGEQFVADMEELLTKHQLAGLLEAAWVKRGYRDTSNSGETESDRRFIDALEELADYAYQEVDRITRARARGDDTDANRGILFETQALLGWYRAEIAAQAYLEGGQA